MYLIKGYRGHVGVTDQTRVYVTTCQKTNEKNFVIVTPVHPEVTPRNWTTMLRLPRDMEGVMISSNHC
jgi:hypothetical protein